jgi:O-6-methylguanine DNA methyltransferase
VIEKSNHILEQTKKELSEYFTWKRKEFDIPLLTFGTDFQKRSWEVLRKIQYGETWSYKKEAEKVGSPKAVRAVWSANGKNRIGIIIPCHRVIGNNGWLGGFGWGLEAKKRLLEHEQKSII